MKYLSTPLKKICPSAFGVNSQSGQLQFQLDVICLSRISVPHKTEWIFQYSKFLQNLYWKLASLTNWMRPTNVFEKVSKQNHEDSLFTGDSSNRKINQLVNK